MLTTMEWLILLTIAGAASAGATWAILRYASREQPTALPPTTAVPQGQFSVRWEHIDHGSGYLYQGPDLKRARWFYYRADTERPREVGRMPKSAGVRLEFWDGSHRRAARVT